jgi:hypothetical protein
MGRTCLAALLAILVILPSCAFQSRPFTTPDACGVEVGTGVSKGQAFCIAKRVGLPDGLAPWEAGIEPAQPGEKSCRWVVFNREAQEECPKDGIVGTAVVIDMRDGKVLGSRKTWVVCCPAGSSQP